jgi:hypothetical protein
MKKLLSAALITVFALSFVIGGAVTKADIVPASLCMATCDFSVGLTWVCCPVYKGNSGKVHWDCYYDGPCGTLP